MARSMRSRIIILVAALVVLVASGEVAARDPISFRRGNITYTLFDVSVRKLPLLKGDRIERFECEVLGTVERIDIPFEWKVIVDNPTGDHTKITAEAGVGAAAFPDDTKYFRRFARVGKMSIPGETPQFDMSMTLWISDKNDEVRKAKLSLRGLELTPASSALGD
jgi:hypothetical protein